jgi:uncharacterized membrane protein
MNKLLTDPRTVLLAHGKTRRILQITGLIGVIIGVILIALGRTLFAQLNDGPACPPSFCLFDPKYLPDTQIVLVGIIVLTAGASIVAFSLRRYSAAIGLPLSLGVSFEAMLAGVYLGQLLLSDVPILFGRLAQLTTLIMAVVVPISANAGLAVLLKATGTHERGNGVQVLSQGQAKKFAFSESGIGKIFLYAGIVFSLSMLFILSGF